jgi:hypothetical protein
MAPAAATAGDGVMAGVLVIIGGILVHLTLGTFYCAGNLNPFVPDRRSMLRAPLPYQGPMHSSSFVCTSHFSAHSGSPVRTRHHHTEAWLQGWPHERPLLHALDCPMRKIES